MPIDISNIKNAPSVLITWEESRTRKAVQILFRHAPSDHLVQAILSIRSHPGYEVIPVRMQKGEVHIECPYVIQVEDVAKEFARFIETDFGRLCIVRQSKLSSPPGFDEDRVYANNQGGFTLDFEAGIVKRVEGSQAAANEAARRRLLGQERRKQ